MSDQYKQNPYGSVRERGAETTPTKTSQYLSRNTPPSGQDSQSKFNLYSEIEKITVINLDLKKQNENLIRELEKQSFLISKIPELEAKIIDQEKELARKENNISQTIRDQEFLRKDLSNLQKLEPAYNELFAHNKRLLSEIDDLNNQLERSIQDKERLEADLVGTHAKLNEALKRNDNYSIDLDEQKKENYNVRDQNKLLNDKLRGAGFENERLQNLFNDAQREIQYLKQRQSELEKGHADQVINLADKIENEKANNYEMTSKFISEKNHLENDLKHASGKIDELQHKLNVMVSENDKLHKLNLDANHEIETLNQKLFENQRRHIEDHEKLEKDRRNQLDSQGKELTLEIIKQRQQYEDRIGALKSEILELQKLHDVIHEKEKEIESLKLQNNYNEKNWERKLQNAVESERSNNHARFGVERGELQNEINSRGLRINELERKITSLTNEIERLGGMNQEKEKEIREQRNNLIQNERESRLAFDDLKSSLNAEKRQELDDLEMGLRRVYEAQLDLLKDRIADLEDKVARLSDENARLALSNDEKQSEIDLHKYRIHVQEQKHANYSQDMERIHNDKLRAAIERERSNTQAQCNIELTKYETKIAEQDKDIVKLEQKTRMLDAEIDRLGTLLSHKQEELNHEKRRMVDLDTQKAQELAHLNENFEIIKRATVDLATATSKLEAEKLALNTQIKQQRERIEQLEKRLGLMVEENENLRAVYNQKVEHLEDMRKTYIEDQGKTEKDKNALFAQIEGLRAARLDISELTIRHAAEKAQYENQIRQLKTLCDNNKDELEKIYEVLNARKKELDALTKNYDDLRAKHNNLNSENRNTNAEAANQKDINDKLNKKAELLEKERNLYQSKNDELNNDLNKTNDDLRQKCKDLDDLKKKYDESMQLSTKLSAELMNKLAKLH